MFHAHLCTVSPFAHAVETLGRARRLKVPIGEHGNLLEGICCICGARPGQSGRPAVLGSGALLDALGLFNVADGVRAPSLILFSFRQALVQNPAVALPSRPASPIHLHHDLHYRPVHSVLSKVFGPERKNRTALFEAAPASPSSFFNH